MSWSTRSSVAHYESMRNFYFKQRSNNGLHQLHSTFYFVNPVRSYFIKKNPFIFPDLIISNWGVSKTIWNCTDDLSPMLNPTINPLSKVRFSFQLVICNKLISEISKPVDANINPATRHFTSRQGQRQVQTLRSEFKIWHMKIERN